jgi:TRAP transporter T-component
MIAVARLALAAALAQAAEPGAPGPAAATAPAPAPAVDAFADLLRRGLAAFAERDDSARLAESIARLGEAAALRPGDPAADVPLARAQAFRAQSSPREAREAWREASRAAERALRAAAPAFAEAIDRGEEPARAAASVSARGAEPLYWLALATMGMAQARGMAAVLAVKDAARAMMERAAALDEKVDHGGPRRALGAWLATIPSAAGGGAAAARQQLERARALAPDYQLTRVREAESLAVLLQDAPRFDALLDAVLAYDVARRPEIAPENRLAQRLARDLKARRDRLF